MLEMKENLNAIKPYKAGKTKPGAVKLSSNENPLGASPKALEAITEMIQSVNRYPDGACSALRQKLAERNKLSVEETIIGNGSDEILAFVASAFINPGENGIFADPTFSEYEFSLRLFGGKPTSVPLRQGATDFDGILKVINPQTRIIFICNPNNPTGTYRNNDDFKNFLKQVPEEIVVVSDEAYFEYADASDYPQTLSWLTDFPNLIITRTFSKIYGLAGLRVGYAFADKSVIDILLRCKQAFNVNLPAQIGANAALDDKTFLEKSCELNRKGKNFLYKELEKNGFDFYPTQSNFICINVKRDCLNVFEELADRGIAVRPCASFGLPEYIRYTIGTEQNNKDFIRLLKELY